jgi:hypothetical protein
MVPARSTSNSRPSGSKGGTHIPGLDRAFALSPFSLWTAGLRLTWLFSTEKPRRQWRFSIHRQ